MASNKQFHEMLGILCNYGELAEKITDDQSLKKEAAKRKIKLSAKDVEDLSKCLSDIRKLKKAGYLASPRN
jgi:hypothetical protein